MPARHGPALASLASMTDMMPAGDRAPRTPRPASASAPARAPSRAAGPVPSAQDSPGLDGTTRVRVDSLAGVLAVVPFLLGFHPRRSLVVIGVEPVRGRVKVTFRYDLPDPPDPRLAAELAAHAAEVLGQQRIGVVLAVGYGAGPLVTPVMAEVRAALAGAGIVLRDLLRVQDGRYWSYLCASPRCCPAEGVPFDALAHPAAAELTVAGVPAYPDREALSRSVAPLAGPAGESMRRAIQRVLSQGQRRPVVSGGRRAVRDAIGIYRGGGQLTGDDQFAWLCVTLADLRVRDDAWARMAPEHRKAHQRLWTDVVRRASPAYVPAPASLLAFTAWQSGDGSLANIALERALAADPAYSMALLLSEAVESGLPPSAARLPMTPEEVEASYRDADGGPG